MEVMQKDFFKFYYLNLADVRGSIDVSNPIVGSFELSTLMDYYNSQKDPWIDEEEQPDFYGRSHKYNKTFKKGSELEWYNDISHATPEERPSCTGGIGYVWLESTNPEHINCKVI